MNKIKILEELGVSFAENKDIASRIREEQIMPLLKKKRHVALDFKGIDSATQSFIHALISELFRIYGADVLDLVEFKNCNETVREVISIVAKYMQL